MRLIDLLQVRVEGRPLPVAMRSILPTGVLDHVATDPFVAQTRFSLVGRSPAALSGDPVDLLQSPLKLPLHLHPGGAADWYPDRAPAALPAAGPPPLLPDAMRIALAQQWAQLGAMMMHAAVVRVGEAGVLILGDSGAGKSTLAMAALHAGGALVSDDWVVLVPTSAGLCAHRLRGFLSSRDGSAQLLEHPALAALPRRVRRDRRMQLELPADSARFPASARITHLWCLQAPTVMTRPRVSLLQSINATEVFLGVLRASVPLLFEQRFAQERSALLATVNQLVGCACRRVTAGLDVLERPAAMWERVLASA